MDEDVAKRSPAGHPGREDPHRCRQSGPTGPSTSFEFQTDPAGVRAEVVALDLDGRRKPGWPYRLPFDPAAVEIDLLTVSSDGRLYVVGGDTLLALDPDGHLSR